MNDAMRFLHVVSALGLTAAFGVEAAGLVGLRRATSAAQALLWLRTRRWVLLIGPGSIGLVLATGIYLTVAEWGTGAWIVVSLVSLVALASIGGVLIGVPMVRITPAIRGRSRTADGPAAAGARAEAAPLGADPRRRAGVRAKSPPRPL